MEGGVFWNFGFKGAAQFVDSTFHPKSAAFSVTTSGLLGTVAYKFEAIFGFEPIVALLMLGLFSLELFTGIKASIHEGNKFESRKFGRAWLKMFVYLAMIGFAHLFSTHMEVKPIFGWEFNYYEWMHYTFLNYVVIQMFISNIENFARLGWDEFVPAIAKLKEFLRIKLKKDE